MRSAVPFRTRILCVFFPLFFIIFLSVSVFRVAIFVSATSCNPQIAAYYLYFFFSFCLTEGTNIMREKSECCLCDLWASVVSVVSVVSGKGC